MTAVRRLLPPLLLATLLAACSARTGGAEVPETSAVPAAAVEGRATRPTPLVRAGQVLAAFDRRRAAAYAEGSAEALRALYVDGSRAGAADVRLLRDYRDRGLTVEHLGVQVLALRVLDAASGRLRIEVTDRLVGVRVAGEQGVLDLPQDRPTTRVVTFLRPRGEWQVASVSPVRR